MIKQAKDLKPGDLTNYGFVEYVTQDVNVMVVFTDTGDYSFRLTDELEVS